jgi:hypothetical protein
MATKDEKQFTLPITARNLEEFCIWAGRNLITHNENKILAVLLKKYLAGLKGWHTFHNKPFPDSNKARLDLILKASAKEDEVTTRKIAKLPIMLWHLTHLWKELFNGSPFDKAVLDLCIVAFWGLACIAELSYDHDNG